MTGRRWAAVALYVVTVGGAVYYAPDILSGSPAALLALAFLPAPLAFLARKLWKPGEGKDGGRL